MGANQQHLLDRLHSNWPLFLSAREEHLRQDGRYGDAAEKVTENILADLFTTALDWRPGDLNHQVEYADLVLSTFRFKRIVIEAKRPRALLANRHAIDAAIDQVIRYASRQFVKRIAISDGYILYAADYEDSSIKGRVFVRLDDREAPEALWWLSVNGIYQTKNDHHDATIQLYRNDSLTDRVPATFAEAAEEILHKEHKVPARCFAYVGDPNQQKTWKLPYLTSEGAPDMRRLSGAIGSIVTNHHGKQVKGIPEAAIPDILVRLGKAAWRAGKMPGQASKPAKSYIELQGALLQLGRLGEIENS